jgi:LAO/AO transport system kinase
VNKADRENAEKAASDIQASLELATEKKGWKPPVVKTSALTGEGIAQLIETIEQHRQYLKKGALDERRKERAETELLEALREKITEAVINDFQTRSEWKQLTKKIVAKQIDPYTAAEKLLTKTKRTKHED